MIKRSLSHLYRAGIRRENAGIDADQALELVAEGDVHPQALERLARTPDAPAVLGIARSIKPWSAAFATEIGRDPRSTSLHGTTTTRKLGWVSLAAAASLAVIIFGLQPSGESDAPVQASAGPTDVMSNSGADVLFADPDGMLLSARLDTDSESIFADSLDM